MGKRKQKNKGRKSKQTSPGKSGKAARAQRADKYDLYQQSVQVPEADVSFFERVHKKLMGRPAQHLREDFCGTAAVCCEWVRGGKQRTAYGVDLDPEPLDWGRRHNLSQLDEAQRSRVELVESDVREVIGPRADIVAAQNFSFYTFMERSELRSYFESARRNLKPEGLLVLDMMGGSQAMEEDREEIRDIDGFKYIWEQRRFDPITHFNECHIHFRFKDGSKLKRAFSYRWRLWSIPEVRELLDEAGFAWNQVYWEGTDPDTGEGNGEFRPRKQAPSDPAWIAYIVAVKEPARS
jgi:cyclopropane fatty-acyl-phospholipid synthase-like methyltransferase